MTVPPSEASDARASDARASDALDPGVADYLLGVCARTLPAGEDEAADLARSEAIRAAFQSMRPRNPMEAMLAVELIASHHVIMDCFRLALRPDTDPAAAARARGNAAALSRVRLANLHKLETQQAPAPTSPHQAQAAPKRAPHPQPPRPPRPRIESGVDPGNSTGEPTQPVQSGSAPGPAEDPRETTREPAQERRPTASQPYLPRDRFGKQIPLWRWEYMTMAQRRAAYADPKEVALHQAAIAEEEAAIAEQAAMDAEVAAQLADVTPQPVEPPPSPHSPADALA